MKLKVHMKSGKVLECCNVEKLTPDLFIEHVRKWEWFNTDVAVINVKYVEFFEWTKE